MSKGNADYAKYQQVSQAFKVIIDAITTLELGHLKMFFVNLQKKIYKKENVYGQYTSLKNMLDNFKQAKSKVALHFAVARGDLQIVKHMIENMKLDIYVKDSEGNNPFFTAIEHGHFQLVRYFIEELNLSPNSTKQGQISCLHIASNHQYPQIMSYLLSKGADIEKVSIYGKPINWAVGANKLNAVKILLQNKANPNGDLTCPAPAPLILAIDFTNKQMYELLLKYGADVFVKDPHGYSCLQLAAEKGNLYYVKELINLGLDIDYQVNGKSALFLAFENHKFEIVNFLKQKTKSFEAVEKKIKQIREQQINYEQNKPKAEEIKQLGNRWYGVKNYTEALKQYKRAIQFDHDNTVIHRNMAACYLALNQFSEALHECQLAKVGDAKNVKTLYREAQACVGLGNLVEATSSFWECSMLEAENPLFKKEFQKYLALAKKVHGKK